MKKTYLGAAAALLLSTSLTFAAGTHPSTGEALADDQTFTYRLLDDVPTFDPQLIEDVSGSHVARQLFEGLLNQDAPGNNIPGVAESWEASEGNTVWTFNLRDDAKWSNGDPVTAHDFVYAWQRAADPATASPMSSASGCSRSEKAASMSTSSPPALASSWAENSSLKSSPKISSPKPSSCDQSVSAVAASD